MIRRATSICVVTSVPISYNPRVVKEADALCDAGYDVSVVSPLTDEQKAAFDQAIVASRAWRWRPVDVRRRPLRAYGRWLVSALRSRALRVLPGVARSDRLRDPAYSRHLGLLSARAEREHAALYIAHNLPALPAAARAALRTGARLGFDAEDFHRGQFTVAEQVARRRDVNLTMAIEKRHLPAAHHLTAASDGIGRAYARELGIPVPVTILNAFPLAERDAPLSRPEERRGALSLYWYSQVIGPDRGLDDALAALARLDDVHLHLRGVWARGYESAFVERAVRLGVRDRVHVQPPAPPEELIARASRHDIGLALEAGDSLNRELCVSNKLLAYLVAGLAVAATDTAGQREVMDVALGAGFVYSPGDVDALAAALRALRDDPQRLAAAKKCARQAAERRFCWEVEKPKLLGAVERALGRASPEDALHGDRHRA